jgi:AbrB family looped-hinge helix DNA binding protein
MRLLADGARADAAAAQSLLRHGDPIDTLVVIRQQHRSGAPMDTVTISPKYQVVIPKAIREQLGLRAGQKIQAMVYQDRIELVPVRPVRELKGFLRGIDTTVPRERDRV